MPDRDDHPLSRHEIALIREIIHTTIEERDRRYQERFKASEESTREGFRVRDLAIEKAAEAAEAQRERQNEFRGALEDQARLFVTRTEAGSKFSDLERQIEERTKRLESLENTRATGAGKETTTERWQGLTALYLGMALSFIFSIISIGLSLWRAMQP